MIATAEYIPIRELSQHFPNRPSPSTIWRWILRGCRGAKLETITIGGRRYVTAESIDRFIRATTAAANGQPGPSVQSKARQRAAAVANRKLDAAGI